MAKAKTRAPTGHYYANNMLKKRIRLISRMFLPQEHSRQSASGARIQKLIKDTSKYKMGPTRNDSERSSRIAHKKRESGHKNIGD